MITFDDFLATLDSAEHYHDKNVGDFTKKGVITFKSNDFVQVLERGTILCQPFENIKGVAGEKYILDGKVRGIVITNKDEDGYFQMVVNIHGFSDYEEDKEGETPVVKRGKITFLCAPTRSGKSTYTKKWLAEEDEGEKRVVVNADQIRLGVHGRRFDKQYEGLVHYLKEVAIKHHLKEGSHVLVDETNTSMWTIRSLLRLDPDATPVYIPSTREICIQRAIATGQKDLVEKGVIEKHFTNLECLVQDYCGTTELSQANIEKVVQGIKREELI